MIPGFITLYKENDKIHLYFYRGLTDDDKFYYNELSLHNCKYQYKQYKYEDNAVEYVFDNDNIRSMNCKLINYNKEITQVHLEIKE